eukprot:11963694-Ditylum_brightwellii.AAC.1
MDPNDYDNKAQYEYAWEAEQHALQEEIEQELAEDTEETNTPWTKVDNKKKKKDMAVKVGQPKQPPEE